MICNYLAASLSDIFLILYAGAVEVDMDMDRGISRLADVGQGMN